MLSFKARSESPPPVKQDFHISHRKRPYPFAGTVLMGALLNVAIFKLSPRTNAAHFVAIGVLGSLGVNSMHAILKLAGHTKDSSPIMERGQSEEEEMLAYSSSYDHHSTSPSRMPPQHESYPTARPSSKGVFHESPELSSDYDRREVPLFAVGPRKEVYDSNIRFLHVLIVKPLSGLSEILIPWLTATRGIRDVASGVFHHVGPVYTYQDGRRDIQLLIAGVVTAFALKKIAPWFKPSLKADWQTVCTAVLLPALWTKSTQLPLARNGDPGKPWSWGQSLVTSLSKYYAKEVSQRGSKRW